MHSDIDLDNAAMESRHGIPFTYYGDALLCGSLIKGLVKTMDGIFTIALLEHQMEHSTLRPRIYNIYVVHVKNQFAQLLAFDGVLELAAQLDPLG